MQKKALRAERPAPEVPKYSKGTLKEDNDFGFSCARLPRQAKIDALSQFFACVKEQPPNSVIESFFQILIGMQEDNGGGHSHVFAVTLLEQQKVLEKVKDGYLHLFKQLEASIKWVNPPAVGALLHYARKQLELEQAKVWGEVLYKVAQLNTELKAYIWKGLNLASVFPEKTIQIINSGIHKQIDLRCLEPLARGDPALQLYYTKKLIGIKNYKEAASFIKKQKLDPAQFPNLLNNLDGSAVAYYAHTFQLKWQFGEQKFKGHHQRLATYASKILKQFRLAEAAYSIIVRNKIPQQLLEPKLRQLLEQKHWRVLPNPIYEKDAFANLSDILGCAEQPLLTLQDVGVQKKWVKLVYQKQFLREALEDISKCTRVGFDSQFSGGMNKLEARGISLLQVATEKFVYLFDLLALRGEEQRRRIAEVLCNPNLMIIGHTLESDQEVLSEELGAKIKFKKVFDIAKHFRYQNENKTKSSLAFICKSVLGKTICKLNQVSNWDHRPLRQSQLHYGAMDAIVCLRLHQRVDQFKLSYVQSAEGKKKEGQPKPPPQDFVVLKKIGYPLALEGLLDEEEKRFVVDNMLLKLAKELRSLGVDTLSLAEKDHARIVQIAQEDRRIVLTRDYHLFQHQSKRAVIFLVQDSDTLDCLQQIVKYFKIQLDKFELFSRCVKCNGRLLPHDPADAEQQLSFKNRGELQNKNVMRCEHCLHVFWEGGQYQRSKAKYEKMRLKFSAL